MKESDKARQDAGAKEAMDAEWEYVMAPERPPIDGDYNCAWCEDGEYKPLVEDTHVPCPKCGKL